MKWCFFFAGFALACVTLAACGKKAIVPLVGGPQRSYYDSESDWNDQQRIIGLSYEQAQGKRIFYQRCVWCHADVTPSGPSNRSNLTPAPALMNDGTILNGKSDTYLQEVIALGGGGVGKSAMMPPYGKSLTQDEIRALIAYARAIAEPPYQSAAAPSVMQTGK